MIHNLRLNKSPYEFIKNGVKKIEMRLFDEKRQQIKPGDVIEFENRENGEKLCVKVLALHVFENFSGIYDRYPKEWLGYRSDEVAKPEDMEQYYLKEEIEEYGVVGIEIELIKN